MDSTMEDILAILRNYTCQYSQDEEGNGISLVDVLTPVEGTSIKRGLLELELLAEHITDALFYRDKD